MLAAGSRYETPESQGHRALRRAHVLQGHRTPPDRPDDLDRDRRDRRRVQRVHRQGAHRLLRPLRLGDARRRARRAADMLLHSRFDEAEIEKEKGVILEEMNVYLDTPQRYVGNVYDRLLYADQPLGWDILGTRETIEGTTRETFLSYLDTWYRPERMVVGIGGRIGRRPHGAARGAPRRHRATADGRCSRRRAPAGHLAGPRAHEGLGAGAPHPRRARLPDRSPEPLRAPAARRRPRRRDVVATLHGGAREARSRLLRPRGEHRVHGRGHVLRERRRGRRARRRGDHDDPRRDAEDRRRAGAGRRAREGTRLREGPLRPPPREPAGDDPVRPPHARCSRARSRSPTSSCAASTR